MASIAHQIANNDYDDLVGISIIPGGSAAVWSDNEVDNIKRYHVNAMDEALIVQHGEYIFDCLKNTADIDNNLIVSMLHVAVHLRDPDNIKNNLLIAPTTNKSSIINVTLPSIREIQEAMSAEEKALMDKLKNISGSSTSDTEEIADGVPSGGKETTKNKTDKSDLSTKAAAYAYICAFLMRLQCRSENNVNTGIKKAVARFKTWYDCKTEILDGITFPIEALKLLKEAISRKPEIVGTWVLYLAVTENEKQLLKQPRGMLEYLGLQVFSYQGMHALTQVLALHQISKMPLKELLAELDSPLTRDGTKEIANVIRHHERTTKNMDRKTYFRYARVWDMKYFTQLQSKVCIPLLYVSAVAVRDLSPNKDSDPTNIYVLQNMGQAMKATLDRVAAALIAHLTDRSYVDARSGSVWDHALSHNE